MVALLISEIILVLACYTSALFLLVPDPYFYLFDEDHWWKLLFVTGFIILALYLQDLYGDLRIISRILLVQQVCLAVGGALLAASLLGYIRAELLWGRWLMIVGSLSVIIIIPAWRIFFWRYIIAGFSSERVLLMGNSSILGEVIDHLATRPEFGYSILGYLCEDEPCDFAVTCLGKTEDVRKICEEYQPTRIVVGMAERRNRLPVEELLDIRFGGIMIEDAADTYEVALRRVCSRKIQPSQLIFSSGLGPRKGAIALQKLYSFVIGIFGLIVLSPFLLITAIAVKLTSPGPMLYSQRRVGLNGRTFMVYKFRSMYVDAEARTGAVWAKKDDPRITPVGKWLRKLRLDELPQMWNVVRGDMSIVGPRPERPEFVEQIRRHATRRHDQARIRPLLHQAPGPGARFLHHLPHHQSDAA